MICTGCLIYQFNIGRFISVHGTFDMILSYSNLFERRRITWIGMERVIRQNVKRGQLKIQLSLIGEI